MKIACIAPSRIPSETANSIQAMKVCQALAENGHTVIVSSHVLAEIERMTNRVLAIVDGKLAAAGDVAAIRGAMSDIPYRVRIDTDLPRDLASALIAHLTGAMSANMVRGCEGFRLLMPATTSPLFTP